jgi:hypothetical protein
MRYPGKTTGKSENLLLPGNPNAKKSKRGFDFFEAKRGNTDWVFPALSPKKAKSHFAFFANSNRRKVGFYFSTIPFKE